MDFHKEILKGYVDIIIISILKDEEMYGYEILKKIKEKTQNIYEMKEATLYVSLKRLEKKELIKGYWREDECSGGGRRRYYKVLNNGIEFYNSMSVEWDIMKKIIDSFIT